MQPTYLPWAGYFYLCSSVDTFVYLDDVQFERRSWQSRNRILLDGREHFLTVPCNKVSQDTLIKEITICNSVDWIKSHITRIEIGYPDFPDKSDFIRSVTALMGHSEYLADVNIGLIEYFMQLLDIRCETVRASDLNVRGRRSEHLADICYKLNATSYLSPIGSREYLEADNFTQISGIEPTYSNFDPLPYRQKDVIEFIPHLSVVDLIGSCGLGFARKYVRDSR